VGFSDLLSEERVILARQSLHWKLSQVADVVGVDYSAQVVEQYSKLGIFTSIVPGDVQELAKLPLGRRFDVVIAGDIIEHRYTCDRYNAKCVRPPELLSVPVGQVQGGRGACCFI